MNQRVVRLFVLILVFWGYTIFKIDQAWPSHLVAATFFSTLLFFLMLSEGFFYRANPAIFHRWWFAGLAWGGSLAMGLWATFVILSIPFDLIETGFFVFDSLFPGFVPRHANLVFEAIPPLIFSASLFFAVVGYLEILRGPRIKKVSVKFPNLPSALQGLKFAQISDLHIGPTIRKKYVEQTVHQINKAEVDFIVVTGDLVDAHLASIKAEMTPLRNLRSRYGVFYVTGNHEYYWEARGLIRELKELGFQVLLNENKVFEIGSAKVMIAGATDPVGGMVGEDHATNLPKAASHLEKADLKILLAHRPDASTEAERLGFDLQFSGHTHAGQFFPFSLLIGFAHKYTRGLYQQGNLRVYVNPGTGYWGPPNRLGVAPEITLLEIS